MFHIQGEVGLELVYTMDYEIGPQKMVIFHGMT